MKKYIKSWMFYLVGISSLAWFLVRVIPKPSRAAYPCMKAAAPIASSFVLYLLGISGSLLAFSKARKFLSDSRYLLFAFTLVLSIALGLSGFVNIETKTYALTLEGTNEANNPIGVGKGVMPGRVVWVHNPDATDDSWAYLTYWMDDVKTNPIIVKEMVSESIQKLAGVDSDETAWDKIFKYHNNDRKKGEVGYQSGEKIAIKVNLNSNRSKYLSGEYVRSKPNNVDTSPQIIIAILDQLVNKAGVAQEDIYIGDPGRNFDNKYYGMCTIEFPNVNYWGEGNGRTPNPRSSTDVIFSSDGTVNSKLPQIYIDAEYMINIPVFKKHHRGGISLSSKNHFGAFVDDNQNASRWHFSLPVPEGKGDVSNGEYGSYRCFVDIMGHKDIGGKTILYLIDGLWSSTNNANPPIKWRMAPFNDDYPSSIFASMDPVAIESVGYDFLYNEFGPDHPTEGAYDPQDNKGPFPRYPGVDDFLRQAADSLNWPEGIIYDPENDGTPLARSLGVHEHWNNASEKKYSRDMGSEEGIELLYIHTTTDIYEGAETIVNHFQLKQNYPNPFNPSTTIEFALSENSHVKLSIFDVTGQLIRTLVDNQYSAGTHSVVWNGKLSNGQSAVSGVYFYKVHSGSYIETRKMILEK